jgi:hypothetical protein
MSAPDFFDMVRDRHDLGARTIAIAESADIDPRDALTFAAMIDEELADVAVYAKLLSDRIRKIAARADAWERQGIARMMRAIHEEHDPA